MLYHKKDMQRDVILTGAIGAVYSGAILLNHPIGCIIHRITGIQCPTCGMSSSVYHAIRFDFEAAFYFHPLFFIVPIVALYYGYETYFRKTRTRYFNGVMISVIVLFMLVYIIRMIWFRHTLV